jgi:hypothetical protein
MSAAPPKTLVLADRVALLPAICASELDPVRVPPGILAAVRAALLAGDTHYTSRPGVPALRRQIAGALARRGIAGIDADLGVVVTSGERESLFVALLANRQTRGLACVLAPTVHEPLFHFMGWDLAPCSGSLSPDARLLYREADVPHGEHWEALKAIENVSSVVDLLNLGARLTTADAMPPVLATRTLIIGSCRGLAGQEAFGTGFVAGPAALLNGIRTWKQAFSICTAAPAQRAALTAFEEQGSAA